MERIDTIIIGAGLTGLTTAFYINKAGKNFKVLEQSNRPGGVINSISENGFLYETGPNTGIIGSVEIADLFTDLKGLCELELADEAAQKRYILKKGKWEALPSGLIDGIKTNLFTLKDKIRLLGEPFRRRGNNPHENLSDLVKRRLGQSFLDYAIDPFISGVYAGDTDYLIPKYALPKLYNLEQDYGSFIGGAIKKGFAKKEKNQKKITRKVFSVKEGLVSMTHALYNASGGERNFLFNTKNIKLKKNNEGIIVSLMADNKTHTFIAKNVITTVPAPNLMPFFADDFPEQLSKITKLKYARVLSVAIGFKNWTGMPLDGFGGLIPSNENRNILGYLFLSSFLKNRAPNGGALITSFMGGIKKDPLFDLPDDTIIDLLKKESLDLLQLKEFNPDLLKISRYSLAIPQYGVNSGVRFTAVDSLEHSWPGLIIGGNLKNGIGMADRVKQGKELADRIM